MSHNFLFNAIVFIENMLVLLVGKKSTAKSLAKKENVLASLEGLWAIRS